MKRVIYFVSAAVLLVAPVAFSRQMPAGQKIGLATSLQRGYATLKTNFTQAAEKMPEADYSFKPGSTPEARTFHTTPSVDERMRPPVPTVTRCVPSLAMD